MKHIYKRREAVCRLCHKRRQGIVTFTKVYRRSDFAPVAFLRKWRHGQHFLDLILCSRVSTNQIKSNLKMAWSISRLVKYLFLSSCFARSSVVLEASSRFGRMEVDMTETVNSKAPVSDGPCDEIKLFCRPSFLIIGAGKSGTSSLYYYLQDHPQVEPAHMKQVQFFDHQFHRGADWYYRKHFPQRMIKVCISPTIYLSY